MRTHVKDPDAVLDYAVDWTAWLAEGETIATKTATVDPTGEVAVDQVLEAAGVVAVWLSGGVAGSDYTVTCRISTTQGRTDDRSLRILCRQR